MNRLAVDALNLRADARGMGRLVRGMLPELAARFAVTLLVGRPSDARALAPALPAGIAFAAPQSAAVRGRYDALWCPWNGLRFRSAAPVLVMICDDFAFRFPARGAIARWREQRPIRRAVREAAAIVTISAWSRDALATRFGIDPTRIDVLPLAPDPFFFPAPESPPVPEPFVLVVGGNEKRKNIPAFRKMFAEAFPHGEARLVVAGGPGDPVDDAGLRRFYRTARAVAVPSLAEGFGLVAAEAQACGAAVIAAAASALPEAVGDAALLVAPGDRAGWIAALRNVVADDALCSRLRAAGVARWAFAPRRTAGKTLAARLQRLVDERA